MPKKLKTFLERCDEDTAARIDAWLLMEDEHAIWDQMRDAVQRDLVPEEESDPSDDCDDAFQRSVDEQEEERE